MNKTVVFITFAVLVLAGLAGTLVLLIHRPDASATFTSLLVTVLGLATTAAGTFFALGKQGEKIDTIQRQTNGNLSRVQTENERLTKLLAERGVNPTAEDIEEDQPRHARE